MWFACVFIQAGWLIVPALLYLVFHLRWIGQLQELYLIIPLGIGGYILDALLQWIGIFSFESVIPPVWLLALWLVFSSTLCHLFKWLHQRFALTVFLGAIGGASAYASAVVLGAGESHLSPLVLFLVMAIVWAGWFPLCIYLAASYLQNYRLS